MPNIELLDKVLKHIEDHPETWNQKDWRCGTSYCFAGHAAVLSGWKPEGSDMELYWRLHGFESEESALEFYARHVENEKKLNLPADAESRWGDILNLCTKPTPNTNDIVLKDGDRHSIAMAAQWELDLDEETADTLFDSSNSLDDLRNMIQEIKISGRLHRDDWH